MNWTETGAIVLAILLLVPVALVLLCAVATLSRITIALLAERKRRTTPYKIVPTEFGPFQRHTMDDVWEGEVAIDGAYIFVQANDLGGRPDPELLSKLPAIVAAWPQLEQTARTALPRVAENHKLTGLASGSETCDYVLWFTVEDEAWTETVVVEIKNQEVISASAVE